MKTIFIKEPIEEESLLHAIKTKKQIYILKEAADFMDIWRNTRFSLSTKGLPIKTVNELEVFRTSAPVYNSEWLIIRNPSLLLSNNKDASKLLSKE